MKRGPVYELTNRIFSALKKAKDYLWVSHLVEEQGSHPAETPPENGVDHISVLPMDLLVKILLFVDNMSDRQTFIWTSHRFRNVFNHIGKIETPNFSDDVFIEVLGKQQAEIEYLLQNTEAILAQSNNDKTIVYLFEMLSSLTVINDILSCSIRDFILDELNQNIILSRINKYSKILDCENCYLTRFPESILTDPDLSSYWQQLRVLILKGNRLNSLPNQICSLSALKQLYLNDNQFSALPGSIKQIISLEMIDLIGNNISSMPVEETLPPNLAVLNLFRKPMADNSRKEVLDYANIGYMLERERKRQQRKRKREMY